MEKNTKEANVQLAKDELEFDLDLDDLELDLGDLELDSEPVETAEVPDPSDELEERLDDLFAHMEEPGVAENDHVGLTPKHLEMERDDIIYDAAAETTILTTDEMMDILDALEPENDGSIVDLGMLLEEDDALGTIAEEENDPTVLEFEIELDDDDIINAMETSAADEPVVDESTLEMAWDDEVDLLLESVEEDPVPVAEVIPMARKPIVVDEPPEWMGPDADGKDVFTTTIVRNTRTGMYHLKTNDVYSRNSWDTFNGAMGALYSELLSYMEPYKQRLAV